MREGVRRPLAYNPGMRILTRAARLGVLLAGLHCCGLAAAATLERGNGPEPSTLDPHRCPEVACGNVLRDLFEGLVAEDGGGRLVPGLAERWEVSPDGRTWTFHLREGARWSNGQPLDAAQVLASLRRAFAQMHADEPLQIRRDALEDRDVVGAVRAGIVRLGRRLAALGLVLVVVRVGCVSHAGVAPDTAQGSVGKRGRAQCARIGAFY